MPATFLFGKNGLLMKNNEHFNLFKKTIFYEYLNYYIFKKQYNKRIK